MHLLAHRLQKMQGQALPRSHAYAKTHDCYSFDELSDCRRLHKQGKQYQLDDTAHVWLLSTYAVC